MNIKLSVSAVLGKLLVVLYAIIVLVPFYLLIVTALKPLNELNVNPLGLPRVLAFENFRIAIEEAQLARYFVNSVIVTVVSVSLIIFMHTVCAFGIFRMMHKRLGNLIYSIIIVGLMVPSVGYAAIIITYRSMGLYNSLIALIISAIAGALPFSTLIMVGFLKTVPKELMEASVIDGCGNIKMLIYIIVPVLMPAITTIAVLNILSTWNNVFGPLILLTDRSKYTIPLGLLAFKGQHQTKFNFMFAGVIITCIPILVIYFAFQKKFVESLAGSVKG